MSEFNAERWKRLWTAAGAAGDSRPWYEQLQRAYSEPQRYYHNKQHISDCLAEFDQARHLASSPLAVEFALWFHDAVYDPKASDNEERSASLAEQCLESAGLVKHVAITRELVMATKKHDATSPDAALMVDIDLSIFGKPENRFAEYERQIGQEYSWVPTQVFNSKRAEILQCFLEREHLFKNEYFRVRYEQNARGNLRHSIRALQG